MEAAAMHHVQQIRQCLQRPHYSTYSKKYSLKTNASDACKNTRKPVAALPLPGIRLSSRAPIFPQIIPPEMTKAAMTNAQRQISLGITQSRQAITKIVREYPYTHTSCTK